MDLPDPRGAVLRSRYGGCRRGRPASTAHPLAPRPPERLSAPACPRARARPRSTPTPPAPRPRDRGTGLCRPVYEVRLTAEVPPGRRRPDQPRTNRRRPGVRGARPPVSGRRPAYRIPRRPGGRCRRCCSGRLRQGLRRAGSLSRRVPGSPLAPADRGQRRTQPTTVSGPTGRSRRAGFRGGIARRRRWIARDGGSGCRDAPHPPRSAGPATR